MVFFYSCYRGSRDSNKHKRMKMNLNLHKMSSFKTFNFDLQYDSSLYKFIVYCYGLLVGIFIPTCIQFKKSLSFSVYSNVNAVVHGVYSLCVRTGSGTVSVSFTEHNIQFDFCHHNLNDLCHLFCR